MVWTSDYVTSGYVKKQQKTDKQEIERALRKMHEFIKEQGKK